MLNHQYHFLAKGQKKQGRGRRKKEIEAMERLGNAIKIPVIMPAGARQDHLNGSVTRLGDLLFEKIKSQILSGELKEGDLMPSEKEYSQRFGIGRSTVRETIKTLAHMRVVKTVQGRGTFVMPQAHALITSAKPSAETLQQWSLREACEARLAIEVELASLAAGRARAEQFRRLEHALARIKPGESKAFAEAFEMLNQAIARAAGNQVLAQLHATTQEIGLEVMNKVQDSQEASDRIIGFAENIVLAIKSNDAHAARAYSLESMNVILLLINED